MSSNERPEEIEGISTDVDGTIGDPELRSANLAPDEGTTPDHDQTADQTDQGPVNAEVGEIAETPGDRTPGDKLNPA